MSSHAPGFTIDLGGPEPLEVGGWDGIESLNDPEQAARTLQEQVDYATLYRQCFSTNAGRFVLNDFIEMFFKQDIITMMDEPGSNAPGIRQGQATVVKRILKMIEFANTGGGKPTGSGAVTEE